MESLDKHGYVIIDDDSIIDGNPISTANIRDGLGSSKYTEEDKKRFFKWAFGWFDIGLFQLLKDKFKKAHKTSLDFSEPMVGSPTITTISRNSISEMIQEPLQELIDDVVSEYISSLNSPQEDGEDALSLPPTDDVEQRKLNTQKRLNASKLKAAAERELKAISADSKWKEADLKRKKTDEIPGKRKEIDLLNKQISTLR
jgi:hypothetical protein